MESKSIFNHYEPFNLISNKQEFDFIKFNQSSENLAVNQNSELTHNIITPSFRASQSKDNTLRKPIRAGKYKFNGGEYPPKRTTNNLDLTEQDNLFLRNHEQKFKFGRFYLLNEQVLRTTYVFLDKAHHKIKNQKHRKIAEEQQIMQSEWIQKYINTLKQMNMRQHQFFQALNIQNKNLFQELFAVLYERWLFRKNNYLLGSKLRKRQKIYKTFKERNHPQTMQNFIISEQTITNSLTMINQKCRANLQNMYCYENLYNDHHQRKQLIIGKMSNLIQKMIQFNSDMIEARIQTQKEPSLTEVEKKINTIISFLNISDDRHEKWFEKSNNRKNKTKSNYISKYAEFFANNQNQNKIVNKTKSSFYKNPELKQEEDQ